MVRGRRIPHFSQRTREGWPSLRVAVARALNVLLGASGVYPCVSAHVAEHTETAATPLYGTDEGCEYAEHN